MMRGTVRHVSSHSMVSLLSMHGNMDTIAAAGCWRHCQKELKRFGTLSSPPVPPRNLAVTSAAQLPGMTPHSNCRTKQLRQVALAQPGMPGPSQGCLLTQPGWDGQFMRRRKHVL